MSAKVYEETCPLCGEKFAALTKRAVREAQRDHLNKGKCKVVMQMLIVQQRDRLFNVLANLVKQHGFDTVKAELLLLDPEDQESSIN